MLGNPVKPKTKRALVTGAGSGIGACYARYLAKLGYELTIVARDRSRLDGVAEGIRKESGAGVEVLPLDLSTTEGAEELVRRVSHDPTIEIVVNNAGSGLSGAVSDTDDDRLRAEANLNAITPHRVTMAAVRAMRARGRGAVVNTASIGAFVAFPYLATYSGSKAFLESFSEALNEELRGTGVVVQALCPGFTRTDIFRANGVETPRFPRFMWNDPETVVEASLAALRRGRAICVPGLVTKFFYCSQKFGARWVSRRIMAFFMKRVKKLPLATDSTPKARSSNAPAEVGELSAAAAQD
jgi:short-subunit dehydrogenase